MSTDLPPLEISCTDLQTLLQSDDPPLLVDCREDDEFAIARIESAVLLPMSEIASRISELEPHRERPIAVYCHHGMRSERVAGWLRQQGYLTAQSVAGGIDRWAQEIEPSMPRY